MSVLFIAEIADVADPARHAEYVRRAGFQESSRGTAGNTSSGAATPRAVFGGWNPPRLIVIEFPDERAARACFDSEDYKRIAPFREGSTRSRAVLVDRCGAG